MQNQHSPMCHCWGILPNNIYIHGRSHSLCNQKGTNSIRLVRLMFFARRERWHCLLTLAGCWGNQPIPFDRLRCESTGESSHPVSVACFRWYRVPQSSLPAKLSLSLPYPCSIRSTTQSTLGDSCTSVLAQFQRGCKSLHSHKIRSCPSPHQTYHPSNRLMSRSTRTAFLQKGHAWFHLASSLRRSHSYRSWAPGHGLPCRCRRGSTQSHRPTHRPCSADPSSTCTDARNRIPSTLPDTGRIRQGCWTCAAERGWVRHSRA
mmetsp:Transcript_9023/g.26949  ORF Transcript_9023/g.26949 Transcript_9023/m.26949 type:complete len:261 (+) Transcript_9023:2980-3762(+)